MAARDENKVFCSVMEDIDFVSVYTSEGRLGLHMRDGTKDVTLYMDEEAADSLIDFLTQEVIEAFQYGDRYGFERL